MDGFIVLGGIVVFFWVVPVFVAHKLTKEKGYEPALGVVLGLFLGWIGVLVAAVLSPKSKPTGPMKTCPHCAEHIQWAAKVCRHCGRDVADAPAVHGSCPSCGAPPAHPPTRTCTNCGALKV